MNELENQLDELFSEDIEAVMSRERSTFDRLAAPHGTNLVLFGAGALGKNTLAGLRKAGVEPLAFADNNAAIWGTEVDGLAVLSPQEAVDLFGKRAAFVVTIYTGAVVRQQLLGMGVTVVPVAPLFWKYADVFLPYVCLDLPHRLFDHKEQIKKGLALWADDASRREYVAQLRWRIRLDPENLPAADPAEDTYFPDDIVIPSPREVFVDCGAFDGDSIRGFLRRRGSLFERVIGLEPDPANFAKLQTFVAGLPDAQKNKVTLLPFAVGARSETLRFEQTGTWASALSDAGAAEMRCEPLDKVLNGGPAPTYIKMDIEGAEPDALAGARTLIGEHTPVLAICLYHRPDDLWHIPLFLRSLSEQYRFFFRRYSDDCWEQVCYVVPANRVAAAAANTATESA